MKGARVGQAVHDILSTDQPNYTVEEILEGMNQKYMEGFEEAIKNGEKKFGTVPFYVLVMSKKELTMLGVTNVMRNYFIARKSKPNPLDLVNDYPHSVKNLYSIDPKKGDFKLEWSVPDLEACKAICKNPRVCHPQLYEWIKDCFFPAPNVLAG